MMRLLAAQLLLVASPALAEGELRRDGVPVQLMAPGVLEAEFQAMSRNSVPFVPFSDEFVQKALATGVDWRAKGAVTPAKDQGAHGYCGTFGRTCAAEGQYAIHSGHGLRNFSEEELVDCIGWDKDQFSYFKTKGFMSSEDYPYCTAGYKDQDPPIPGHPCKYNKSKVIVGTADGAYTNTTAPAHNNEDQLAAWIFKNGPVNTGIDASVFGLREKGCEATGDCFITKQMCDDPKILGKPIDHSITLVGFGTDAKHGDYWIVKNSWSTKFANDGFIKVARGVKTNKDGSGCAHIACCGWVPCYGTCPTSDQESL